MATLADKIAALKAIRATGVLTSRLADGRTVTYRSDAEIGAEIAALEAERDAAAARIAQEGAHARPDELMQNLGARIVLMSTEPKDKYWYRLGLQDGTALGEDETCAIAAIVAYLRMHGMHSTAAIIERGDHIKPRGE